MSFIEDSLHNLSEGIYASDGNVVPWPRLLELGWDELVAKEPELAVRTLAAAQGRHRGSSRLVEYEMSRHLGLDSRAEAIAFVPGGVVVTSTSVDVVLMADAASVPFVIVPVDRNGVVLCRTPLVDLAASAVTGIDAEAGWTRLRGEIDAAAATPVDDATWSRAVAAGRLALAYESIGVAQAMLALAVAHASDRVQFGVPIGTFQAVQHRLADVHVQVESARSIARIAWIEADPNVAAAALMAARGAVESSTEHCHQVMGAIGCTWEHPLHHFIRRGALLSLLLAIDESGYDALVAAAKSTHRTEVFA
jgi:hypothetical protein